MGDLVVEHNQIDWSTGATWWFLFSQWYTDWRVVLMVNLVYTKKKKSCNILLWALQEKMY